LDDEEGAGEASGEGGAVESGPAGAFAESDAEAEEGDGGIELVWEAGESEDISGGGLGHSIGGFGDEGGDVSVAMCELGGGGDGESGAEGPAEEDDVVAMLRFDEGAEIEGVGMGGEPAEAGRFAEAGGVPGDDGGGEGRQGWEARDDAEFGIAPAW